MGVGAVIAVEAGEDPLRGEASESVRILSDTVRPEVERSLSSRSSWPPCAMVLRAPSSDRARSVPSVSRFCALRIAVGGSGARRSSRAVVCASAAPSRLARTSSGSSAMSCWFNASWYPRRRSSARCGWPRGHRGTRSCDDPRRSVRDRGVRPTGVVAELPRRRREARWTIQPHGRDDGEALAQVAMVGAGEDADQRLDAPGEERRRRSAARRTPQSLPASAPSST